MPTMYPTPRNLRKSSSWICPKVMKEMLLPSKPQTMEEAFNIEQRLMDQIMKRDSIQETNDHKQKLEDKGNIINTNYQNNYNNNNRNNDYNQQQNRKQETFRTYTATNGKDIMPISAQKQITEPKESILRDELAFVRFRISTLETTLKDIQVSSESSSV
ncbi:hypothetical protein Tco_1107911 [Tanacetum coccineum]